MNFLNRTTERSRISLALQKENPQLIVVYGRRRIGKSVLLESIMNANTIFFMADTSTASIQLKQFADQIAERITGFNTINYPDWNSLFQNLANSLQLRITICLDEFPYLVKNSPELPSVLQRICDKKINQNFNLILCGSSQQMMSSLVINHSAPLYGRATEIMHIKGMNIFWLKEALQCSYQQAIEEFSIWGGVPRYWQIRNEEADFKSAVLNQIFDKYGTLHEEPLRLFMDEMRESVMALSVLNVIGNGANRLSEIAARLNKPANSLSGILQTLIELGFVKREIPFGESLKSTKKTLYKIADQFMLFFFRVVSPNISRLELGLREQVYNASQTIINKHVAECWEDLCRQSIPFMEINGQAYDIASRWWGNTAQNQMKEFDIIAESLDKKNLLIAECKWSDNVEVERLIYELKLKAENLPFVKNYEVVYKIFVKGPKNENSCDYFTPNEVITALKEMN